MTALAVDLGDQTGSFWRTFPSGAILCGHFSRGHHIPSPANIIEANTTRFTYTLFLFQIIAIARKGQCQPEVPEVYLAKENTQYNQFNFLEQLKPHTYSRLIGIVLLMSKPTSRKGHAYQTQVMTLKTRKTA